LRQPSHLSIIPGRVHRDGQTLALVTEFATGGTLAAHVHNAGDALPPAEVKRVGTEVLAAIRNLHGIMVVHRDIKPENILRVEDAWKLGDFGLAKSLVRLHSQRTLRGSWSPGYAPDEQIAGAEPAPSMDVYAFGKVLTVRSCLPARRTRIRFRFRAGATSSAPARTPTRTSALNSRRSPGCWTRFPPDWCLQSWVY
jgi:serine/threonine protein kinase